MSLKMYILPTLKLIFVLGVLNTVSSISNVHSLYQCSCKQCCAICKQCCAIAVYAMCYSLLLIHVETGLQELYLPSQVWEYTVQCDGCEETLCQLIFLKVRVSEELR